MPERLSLGSSGAGLSQGPKKLPEKNRGSPVLLRGYERGATFSRGVGTVPKIAPEKIREGSRGPHAGDRLMVFGILAVHQRTLGPVLEACASETAVSLLWR